MDRCLQESGLRRSATRSYAARRGLVVRYHAGSAILSHSTLTPTASNVPARSPSWSTGLTSLCAAAAGCGSKQIDSGPTACSLGTECHDHVSWRRSYIKTRWLYAPLEGYKAVGAREPHQTVPRGYACCCARALREVGFTRSRDALFIHADKDHCSPTQLLTIIDMRSSHRLQPWRQSHQPPNLRRDRAGGRRHDTHT